MYYCCFSVRRTLSHTSQRAPRWTGFIPGLLQQHFPPATLVDLIGLSVYVSVRFFLNQFPHITGEIKYVQCSTPAFRRAISCLMVLWFFRERDRRYWDKTLNCLFEAHFPNICRVSNMEQLCTIVSAALQLQILVSCHNSQLVKCLRNKDVNILFLNIPYEPYGIA